ncbi:uncharacterized protein M421DRAFT_176132 [Didymella exigua CBS 183.55]|uniref:Heterokaryon incompatibility domain-containing protein n=1 Tax=Didymella exigua CBS 183.55 TaxID=1150837 RepID=A0A6A5RG60_9PLEO|nr:uncharacterized protein M421DRAFT_176132 [Didymella exigua CBS 183.55]KAF1927285.1 hypothetical protein M421DRAFT_176132 [Didymella exigua CBS 183.55]
MNRVAPLDNISVCNGSTRRHSEFLYRWFVTGLVLTIAVPILVVFLVLCILVILPLFPICFLWALLLFVCNILAFCMGRFTPPFEHTPLSDRPHVIRLLKIQPGRWSDQIVCYLEDGDCYTSRYEALSYTWGCELAFGTPCLVNNKMLPLTATLNRALRALRDEVDVRTVWIDAICIDQQNVQEKNTQVGQMLKVYQNAQRVIVWLDVDSWAKPALESVKIAFNDIRQCLAGTEPDRDVTSTETLNLLFRLSYWERMWIIQEIAANSNVVVQCRDCKIDWEVLYQFVMCGTAICSLPEGLRDFMRRVQMIRDSSSTDPEYGLLSFVHDFRYSMATDPRDRLFALLGLVKGPHQLPVKVDYAASETDIWGDFTKNCLDQYKSLNAIAMVDSLDRVGYKEMGPTWLASGFGNSNFLPKRVDAKTVRQPLWLGTDSGSERYAASGGLHARCRTRLVDPEVIGVKGYVSDTIARVYDVFRITADAKEQNRVITQWWTAFQATILDQEDAARAFATTITAGGSLDNNFLRTWLTEHRGKLQPDHVVSDVWAKFTSTIHCSSNLRRIFVTEGNVIGLAHSRARTGDQICILLGSAVPCILRKSTHDGPLGLGHPFMCWTSGCKRRKHLDCCIPELHRLVGQAYVQGIMHYAGDLEQDIEDGNRVLTEFFIE